MFSCVAYCIVSYGAFQATDCATDCTCAIELDPGRVKAYYRRAVAREQLGRDGDALRDAKRAIEVCTLLDIGD